MFSLNNKTALITGASGGIGQEIVKTLHQAGAAVVLTGRNQQALEAVAATLPNSKVVVADLSMPEGIATLLAQAGDVDILINNAGLTKDGLLVRMKDEDWDAVLAVNLTATFRLTRACLKGMMKNRWGRVITITSVVGVMGNAGQANYAASKAGLIGFSKSAAQEVASRGVTVNCIAPGFIQTAMTDALNERQKNAMLSRIPAGSFGQPIDIAGACLYLASDAARYCTGQTLHLNGGMVMV